MSFNRNQKRVAGPGFHVNVRYDDNQVAKMRQQNKVSPVLAHGARLAELHDIKEQELQLPWITIQDQLHTTSMDILIVFRLQWVS